MGFCAVPRVKVCIAWKEVTYMNSTGKFLVTALLVHAANLKKLGDTQAAIPVPQATLPIPQTITPQQAPGK